MYIKKTVIFDFKNSYRFDLHLKISENLYSNTNFIPTEIEV